MNTAFFVDIGSKIEELLKELTSKSLTTEFQVFQGTISVVITLLIMYKGFQTLAGRTQSPIKELVWDIGKKLLILTFVLYSPEWFQKSQAVLTNLYEWAGGGSKLYSELDKLTNSTIDFVVDMFEKTKWNFLSDNFNAHLTIMVILAAASSYFVIILSLAFKIFATTITNTLLVFVLPIAIFCLAWDRLKDVFSRFISLFISNLITLLILSSIAKTLVSTFEKTLTSINASEVSDAINASFKMYLTAFFVMLLAKLVTDIAQGLASVSLDGATQGAMASTAGAAGALNGKTLRVAKDFSGTGVNLGRKTVGAGVNMVKSGVNMAMKLGQRSNQTNSSNILGEQLKKMIK